MDVSSRFHDAAVLLVGGAGKNFNYQLNRGWMVLRASLDVLEEEKISCPCWESIPRFSIPEFSQCTI